MNPVRPLNKNDKFKTKLSNIFKVKIIFIPGLEV